MRRAFSFEDTSTTGVLVGELKEMVTVSRHWWSEEEEEKAACTEVTWGAWGEGRQEGGRKGE